MVKSRAGKKLVRAVNKLVSAVNKLVSAVNKLVSAGNKLVSAVNKLVSAVNKLFSAVNKLVSAGNKLVSAVNKLFSAVNKLVSAGNKLVSAVNKLCRFICKMWVSLCLLATISSLYLIPAVDGRNVRVINRRPIRPAVIVRKPIRPVIVRRPIRPVIVRKPIRPVIVRKPIRPVIIREPVRPIIIGEPNYTKEPNTPVTINDQDNPVNVPDHLAIKETHQFDIALQQEDYFNLKNLVTLKDLFDARVHLGHNAGSRHESMTPYIFWVPGQGTDIIDSRINFTFTATCSEHCTYCIVVGWSYSFCRNLQFLPLVEKTAREVGEYAHLSPHMEERSVY
ncbi:28S ribosomal protein S2, mitochondrial [Bulinus truncatus]|nr:28S ribosomal protein S2, mitochondrial [Bulinus truncatus]